MDHSARESRTCGRACAAFVPDAIDDGIFYPEVGKHAVVDGIIAHIAGNGKVAGLGQ